MSDPFNSKSNNEREMKMQKSKLVVVSAVVAMGFVFGSVAHSAPSAQKTKRKPSSISEISEDPSSSSKYKVRVVFDDADTSTDEGKAKVAVKIDASAASSISCINTTLGFVSLKNTGKVGKVDVAREALLKTPSVEHVLLTLKFSNSNSNYVDFNFQYTCDPSGSSISSCPGSYSRRLNICATEANVANVFDYATSDVDAFNKLNEEKKSVKKTLDGFGSAQPEQDGNSDRSM